MYKYLFLSHFILIGKFQIEYQASSIGLKQHGLSRRKKCLVIRKFYKRKIYILHAIWKTSEEDMSFALNALWKLVFFWKEMDYLHYTINVRGMQPSDLNECWAKIFPVPNSIVKISVMKITKSSLFMVHTENP